MADLYDITEYNPFQPFLGTPSIRYLLMATPSDVINEYLEKWDIDV